MKCAGSILQWVTTGDHILPGEASCIASHNAYAAIEVAEVTAPAATNLDMWLVNFTIALHHL